MSQNETVLQIVDELKKSHAAGQDVPVAKDDLVLKDNVLVLTDWNLMRDYPIGYGENMRLIPEMIQLNDLDASFSFVEKDTYINQY
jgi:hypothetical protein